MGFDVIRFQRTNLGLGSTSNKNKAACIRGVASSHAVPKLVGFGSMGPNSVLQIFKSDA